MQNNSDPGLISWRQVPIIWMLVAIPPSSVVVGMIMLWFAIDSYDGLVVEDYHKQSKQINRRLAPSNWRVQLESNHWRISGLAPVPGRNLFRLSAQ